MSNTPYSVEKEVLKSKYSITLSHLRGAQIDMALAKLNKDLGTKTTITSILKSLVAININFVAKAITAEEATAQVYQILDLPTMFTILPIAIDQEVTQEDVNAWLAAGETPEGLTLFSASTWLAEAGVGAKIVTVADPKVTLLIFRLLRGDLEEAELEDLIEKAQSLTMN